MLKAGNNISIDESELDFSFARSGGPGGQHVNKTSSKVLLRWNLNTAKGIPQPVWSDCGLSNRNISLRPASYLSLVSQRAASTATEKSVSSACWKCSKPPNTHQNAESRQNPAEAQSGAAKNQKNAYPKRSKTARSLIFSTDSYNFAST